jgi:hypothetical protein
VRELAKLAEVELFSFERPGLTAADRDELARVVPVHLVPRGRKSLARKVWDLAFEPWHVKGFSRGLVDRVLARHAERPFDVIHCEELRSARYALALKAGTRALTSLTHHNVESKLFRDLLATEPSALRRAHGALLARRVAAVERATFERLDVTFSYSPVDHQALLALGADPARLVPTRSGCATDEFGPELGGGDPRGLVFVGTLDYPPNVQGGRRFAWSRRRAT